MRLIIRIRASVLSPAVAMMARWVSVIMLDSVRVEHHQIGIVVHLTRRAFPSIIELSHLAAKATGTVSTRLSHHEPPECRSWNM